MQASCLAFPNGTRTRSYCKSFSEASFQSSPGESEVAGVIFFSCGSIATEPEKPVDTRSMLNRNAQVDINYVTDHADRAANSSVQSFIFSMLLFAASGSPSPFQAPGFGFVADCAFGVRES